MINDSNKPLPVLKPNSPNNTQQQTGECVILLHGLARTWLSMVRLARRLNMAGYHTHNIGYPSTSHTIGVLAERVGALIQCHPCALQTRVNFVTHSLGGVLLRKYFKNHEMPNLGRVVMLAPPNQGSELVDLMRKGRLFQLWHGPAGNQLGTTSDSIPLDLGALTFEAGVIAGDRPINPLTARYIPRPNDGMVSVESAKVAGMKAFLVVPASHTFIMWRREVLDQVVHFLKYGAFNEVLQSNRLNKENPVE